MNAFSFLNLEKGTENTMIIDKGLSPDFINDYLKVCGKYITFAKFGWGTSAVQSRELVKEKIENYKKYGIKTYPGGTLFEVCFSKNLFEEYLKECKDLGFECVEISDGSMDLKPEDKDYAIKQAKEAGFIVLSEVGKKSIVLDGELEIHERIELVKKDLESGADFVIIEGRESGKSIGLFDEKGNVKKEELEILAENVDMDKIILEAPQKNQQVEFILRFGNDVNLGNISFEEVISLETLRRGLRGDTFGKI
ncbi:phosphosulfolactate synthase [Methanococcus maripaludis]|uniref:Phosphosulfolactate synthase n=1 Tax=Methanococcus maripaludis TaxID=39152 RepID=A0A7J9NM26_METMI|nr:phosphosulfolactate synthase [Methanococcus maripaludis]MBA2846080.1 phosphosulfolactate synthase [Methanococcus maripaludis]MBA2853204.1 phosphosulfolactate synthase [Methanococcus maripaludis]